MNENILHANYCNKFDSTDSPKLNKENGITWIRGAREMETMKSLGKQKQTLIAKHICDLFERTFNKLLPKIYMYVLYMRIYLCDGLLKPLSKRPAPL